MYPHTIDITKNQLANSIDNHQRDLNINSTYRLKSDRRNILTDKNNLHVNFDLQNTQKRTRNSTQHKVYLHKNLANIQKDQIQLRKLDEANNLIKSRIQDEENLISYNQRFPYGKENVDISEDVLERYRGNYIQQSRMLEKFKMQAQLMKKTSRVKGIKHQPFQWCYRTDVDDNKKKQRQLQKMRQTMQKRQQQQRKMRQFQRKNMKNIVQSLFGLSNQLHNNSYTLQKGIKDLHQRLKKRSQIPTNPFPKKHQYKDIIDLQTSSKKIPVVVYRDQPHDARLYFSDIFKNTEKIKKQDKNNLNRQQYKHIIQILSQNNRRLRYLDKLADMEG